jgi:hypothetical protein
LKVEINVTDQQLSSLLCSALEGGSNYWYEIVDSVGKSRYVNERPFEIHGYLLIEDVSHPRDGQTFVLDRHAIEIGIATMARDYRL